ncbi:unnamed protein product [Symbiodinium sp. CCMP2592]|nr:unnamed protein product [Symbiodinium sp. CCMP2592]
MCLTRRRPARSRGRPNPGVDSTTPGYTTAETTSTTTPPGLSFSGISSAISFREGEVDIAWLPAEVYQEGDQDGIEYFLLYSTGELNLSESDVQSLVFQTSDDILNVSVLSLGEKLEAVLGGLEPKSMVSLLVLAKGPQGEVSDNRRVTKAVIAAKSPELAENVTMMSLTANSSLHIKAMHTNISIIATGIELPLVTAGMCLTGTDSDGTAFLAFVDDVSSLGNTLVATTHDAALTEVFRTLQVDATMDLTGGDRHAGSRRLAVKAGVQVTEKVHLEFARSIAIDPSLEVEFPGWHFALDIDWTGVNSLEVTAGLAWSLGVDVKYAGINASI